MFDASCKSSILMNIDLQVIEIILFYSNVFTVAIDPSHGPFISNHVFTLDVPPLYSGVRDVATGPRLLIISANGPEHQDSPIILDVKTFQRFYIAPPPLTQVSFIVRCSSNH